MPSIYEPFGLVALEAAASGCCNDIARQTVRVYAELGGGAAAGGRQLRCGPT